MSSKNILPKTLLGFVWAFLRPKWHFFAGMIVALIASSITGALRPYVLKVVIDTVAGSTAKRDMALQLAAWPMILYTLVNVGIDLTSRTYEWLKLQIVPKIKAKMRSAMFDYTMNQSYRYFQDQLSGTLSNKILDMVRGFDNLILCVFDCFFPITMIMLIFSILLWQIHWVFGLVTLLWFAAYIGALIAFGRRSMRYSDEQSEANSGISGKLVDVFRNMATVRMFARLPFERHYFDRYQEKEVVKSEHLMRHMWLTHIFQGIASILLLVIMLYLSVYGWQYRWITIGDFTLVANSTLTLVFMAWWMGSQFPIFFKELGVCQQAMSLVIQPHEIVDAEDAKPIKMNQGEIRFKDVTFHYVPERNIFRKKNTIIQPGEKVGLVGFSGSGKTTFVNLIQRYFDLESGQILIDGQDISKVKQQSLREQIAVIPQDPVLFHRTLMENIRYGRLEATDDEVIATSKLAYCHDFIEEINEGYDAIVGEGGVKLSGGQRQRIAIARAMLKNAPILILDEATSALDTVTERKIQQSLHQLMQGKTTIIVAHRLSTLLHLDRIMVFKNGQIIESGSHEELLHKEGHYAHLWKMQTHGFLPENESQ